MTDLQIENRKNEIYAQIYGGKFRCKQNEIRPMTEDEAREMKELDCRQMINSCLCYGTDFYRKIYRWRFEKGYGNSSYADDYIDILGQEIVDRLYQEQKNDFAKARVVKDVHTDSEGVSYNSIVWGE